MKTLQLLEENPEILFALVYIKNSAPIHRSWFVFFV